MEELNKQFDVQFSLFNPATSARLSVNFLINCKDQFEADKQGIIKLAKEFKNLSELRLTYKTIKEREVKNA
jgi:hypothetical protein